MRILSIIHDSIVDGEGLRTTMFFAGCPHECIGCHNPESWLYENGQLYSVDALLKTVTDFPLNQVTFSGGEPFHQAMEIIPLAKEIKAMEKNIWCYTGYTFEWLHSHGNEYQKTLLTYIDTLVDGPFIQNLRDTTLHFRGSTNQRIIDLNSVLLE
ncbi:anaerobic ribonucleoside-triphosphate reductase activating protein [Salipaludibacillus daqingensis]|uniref:anaerobic ribonucleoside-triphosphate reductase activating protein n=1 Tax=Salipaludibacillus daqingensis TaxID=3041001 RepID=UPI002475B210|nr:anaerobic ribonucleoside-triphosphate reductase activating protein [Salipaludibacillus daqingensis]